MNDGAVSGHPRTKQTDGHGPCVYVALAKCVCGGGGLAATWHFFAGPRVGSGSPVSRLGHPGEAGSVSPCSDAKKVDFVPR